MGCGVYFWGVILFCEDVIGFFRGLGKAFQVSAVHIHTVFLPVAEVTNKVPDSAAGEF